MRDYSHLGNWIVRRKLTLFICLLVLTFQMTGCVSQRSSPVTQISPNKPTGTIKAMATLAAIQPREYSVKTSFIRDKTIITQTSEISGKEITVTSPKLHIGEWQIEMIVTDSDGRSLYQGATTVMVEANTSTAVTITLRPADGYLKVRMNLTDFGYIDGLIKGKLLTNEKIYENFTVEDISKPVEVTLQLEPKDYDIAVALYKNAYYDYSRFYTSEYQTVTIHSGRTTSIDWSPAMGDIDIGVEIDDGPKPPDNLTLSVIDPDTALLTWSSADEKSHRFNIYYRLDRQFMGYQLWDSVSADNTEIEIRLDEFADATELEIVVTAVSASGVESHRSNSVYLSL